MQLPNVPKPPIYIVYMALPVAAYSFMNYRLKVGWP